MLECIQKIGDIIESDNKHFIEKIVEKLPRVKKDNLSIIGIINFDTVNDFIEFKKIQPSEDLDQQMLAMDYVWVGNSKANLEQWAITTNTLKYILGDSMMNLAQRVDKNGKLCMDLKSIIDRFYVLGRTKKQGRKQPCLLDLKKIKDQNLISQEIWDDEYFPVDKVANEIIKHITISKEQIILWTVKYNGQLLCQYEEYKHLVEKEKMETQVGKRSVEGICSFCGINAEISYESTKKMEFKYFITDKISFASDLMPDGFKRNMVICSACLKRQILAEKYIKQRLKSRLGDYPTYVIPCFVDSSMSREELDEIAKSAMNSFSTIINLNSIVELEMSLNEFSQDKNENQYMLTLMFENPSSTAASSRFKIAKVLYEVPESRFILIKKQLFEAARVINYCLKPDNVDDELQSNLLKFDLSTLYRYTKPFVRDKKEESKAKRDSLELVTSVITNERVNNHLVISRFVDYLRGLYYSRGLHSGDQSNLSYSENLVRVTLQMNIFLTFINISKSNESGRMKGEKEMQESDEEYKWSEKKKEFFDKAVSFMKAAGYDDVQTGLFYAGILCGNLGIAQYRKLGSSPIFDKINFRGMDSATFIRFYDGLMESLKQYDLFSIPDIQSTAYLSHLNLDRYLRFDHWNGAIRDGDVPFFILSGVSFHSRYRRTVENKKQMEDEINGE